ncbi:MAG: hypothetical protein AB7E96_12145 [Deferribacterales bacterium]
MKILIFSILLLTAGCAETVTVIPSDRQIISLENGVKPMPGWYGISGGFLREIYNHCGGDK